MTPLQIKCYQSNGLFWWLESVAVRRWRGLRYINNYLNCQKVKMTSKVRLQIYMLWWGHGVMAEETNWDDTSFFNMIMLLKSITLKLYDWLEAQV